MEAVGSGAYINVVARRFIGRYLWVGALPLPLIAWGLHADVRFALLGLILLLIVYPMIAVLAILRYSVNPRLAARSLCNHFKIQGRDVECYSVVDDGDMARLVERAHVVDLSLQGNRYVLSIGRGIPDFILLPDDSSMQADINALRNILDSERDEFTSF